MKIREMFHMILSNSLENRLGKKEIDSRGEFIKAANYLQIVMEYDDVDRRGILNLYGRKEITNVDEYVHQAMTYLRIMGYFDGIDEEPDAKEQAAAAKIQGLINEAAEAQELFGDDELEQHCRNLGQHLREQENASLEVCYQQPETD